VEEEAKLVLAHDRGQDDPPAAQRIMSKRAGSTVVEVKGRHSIYVSQPGAVASLIEKATKGAQLVAAR